MSAEPSHPVPLRASDADREAVVAELQDAAADGRIDLDELGTRLEVALSARTLVELAPLTADLVSAVQPAQPLLLKGGMAGAVKGDPGACPSRSGRTAAWAVSGSTSRGSSAGCAWSRSRWTDRSVVSRSWSPTAGRWNRIRSTRAGRSAGQDDPGEAPGFTRDPPDRDLRDGGVIVRHPKRGERRKLLRESR